MVLRSPPRPWITANTADTNKMLPEDEKLVSLSWPQICEPVVSAEVRSSSATYELTFLFTTVMKSSLEEMDLYFYSVSFVLNVTWR